MTQHAALWLATVLAFAWLPTIAVVANEGDRKEFEERRAHLSTMLSDPELFPVRHESFTKKLQSRQWQHFHACLAQGLRLREANDYFASREVHSDEWLALLMLNTYCEFKGSLTNAAKERMREIVLSYAEGLKRRKLDAITKASNENHLINWKTIYLLAAQEFGGGDPELIRQARESFGQWVQYRIRFGMEEFNSPHYAAASLHALLLIYDYHDDPLLKQWANVGIDAMLANYALLSLNNVRGGPYYRTIFTDDFADVAPRDEQRNALDDRLYEVGYLFFGNCPAPVYRKNDGHFLAACITTTKYRVPKVIRDLATDKKSRGRYEVKLHRRDRFGQNYHLYYYMTPAYSLGSMQNRVELDNFHSGRARSKIDHWNNQVWELSFAHPQKILGPLRDLSNMSTERHNPNTANMQHKNVLFYKGRVLDYNNNLVEGGGSFATRTIDGKTLSFWRVATDDGEVYVATTHYPAEQAGILEVGMASDYDSFEHFQTAIESAESHCEDTGLLTRYASTLGDVIAFDHGKAIVNGRPFSLDGYPTYESRFANARWGEAVMVFSINGQQLSLDASDLQRPLRRLSNQQP